MQLDCRKTVVQYNAKLDGHGPYRSHVATKGPRDLSDGRIVLRETNLDLAILIEMPVAQILRSFGEAGPAKNLCAWPSSQPLDTLAPFLHRTIFFSTTGYQPAGIQPRSD